MRKYIVIFLFIMSFLFGNVVFAANLDAKKGAIEAAEIWLKLVDEGRYAESWKNAAGYFKAVIKQEAWEDSIHPLRKSLGEVITRKLKSHVLTTIMPGAPDGEYVIIQFDTSFQNKTNAIETITPMVDVDGVWRVSGYYIK